MAATRLHEVGIVSNRVSSRRGEYLYLNLAHTARQMLRWGLVWCYFYTVFNAIFLAIYCVLNTDIKKWGSAPKLGLSRNKVIVRERAVGITILIKFREFRSLGIVVLKVKLMASWAKDAGSIPAYATCRNSTSWHFLFKQFVWLFFFFYFIFPTLNLFCTHCLKF